jgi:hypothetical protein
MFYPVLLGVVVAYGVIAALGNWRQTYWSALVTGVPLLCTVSAVTSFLAVVLPWVAPAFTATAFARERERGTLDLLRVTPLGERALVWGKLGGSIVRLGPALLTLALLTPFQAAWAWGGATNVTSFTTLTFLSAVESEWAVVWVGLNVVLGWLRPWGKVSVNAALGLFSSTLMASSGAAVVLTYGAILGLRVLLGLVQFVLGIGLMSLFPVPGPMYEPATFQMLVSGLLPLGIIVIEGLLAVLLVEAAVWRLRRI